MTGIRPLVVLLAAATSAPADDWPQWLGPKRDGATSEKVTPWTADPKVLWKFPVGAGHSVPVVAGGKVFVHARVPDKEAEDVIALDAPPASSCGEKAMSEPHTPAS